MPQDHTAQPATGPGVPDGFTVLDGVGFVAGAAAAGLHLRAFASLCDSPFDYFMLSAAYLGIAVTAAGPVILGFARRRGVRGLAVGDRLWCLLGLPWLLTCPFSRGPHAATPAHETELYDVVLVLGVAAACVANLCYVWTRWIHVHPRYVPPTLKGVSWSHHVGEAISIAWPIQSGLCMIALGA